MNQKIFNDAAKVWQKFCGKLGVEIVAPFALETKKQSIACLAYLPHFGGTKGMVVGAMDLPEITIDSYLVKTAKEKGLFYSFINARAYALGKIDDTLFKEMLSDWQYYGPQNKKPQWLP